MNVFRFALLLSVFAVFVSGYVVEGDCVVYENEYGKLSQCPHTLSSFLNYVEVNATSYFNTSQDLDFAFGFDTSQAVPKKAWRWANVSHDVPAYGNVSHSRQCIETNFSFTTGPNYAWCYWANETVKWERAFENGWTANKTVEWFEWELLGYKSEYWFDWVVFQGFSVVEYGGKTWFMLSSVSFEPNETKKLRARIDVKPQSSGKYDIAIKRSSDSWADAFDSGRVVMLDPWWNVSFGYCRNIQLSETMNLSRSYEAVNLSFDASGWANHPYNNSFRVVNSSCNATATEQPYGLHVDAYNGNNMTSGFLVFAVNATAAQNQTWSLYYSTVNQGVPSYSDNAVYVNGTTITLDSKAGYFNVPFAEGSLTVCKNTWTDNFSSCSNAGDDTLGQRNAAVWRFGSSTTTNCSLVEDNSMYAIVECFNVADTNFARRYTITAFSSTIKVFSSHGGADYFFTTHAASSGTHHTVFENDTLSDETNTSNMDFNATLFFRGWYGSLNNETFVWAKYRDLYAGTNETRSFTGASTLRQDWGQYTGGAVQNFTANLTLLVGFEPESGATPAALDSKNFYLKAQYPLVTSLSGEYTPAGYTNDTWFNASCFNEQSGASINFNASFTNTTNATSYSNVASLRFANQQLSGFLTMVVNATGYYSRTYYPVFDGSANVTQNAYLLPTSADAALVRFYIRNTQGTPVTNALVTLAREVGGSWQTIGEQRSDGAGGTLFYLEIGAYYRVYVNATGYAPHTSYITASGAEYTITLTSGAGYANFTTLWGGVRYFFLPTSPYLFATTLNFTLWTTGSDLDYSGWFLHYGNGTILNWTNSTNSTGSTQTYSMLLAAGENLTAAGFFQRSGFGLAWINRTFYHANFTDQNSSLNNTFAYITASTASSTVGLGIVALLILTLLMAWVVRMGGPSGAGVVAVVALGVLTFLGFITWQLFALTAIAAFAVMYLNKGM